MKAVTVTLENELAERLEADARRRGISLDQAAADHFFRLAYEAKHGPVSEDDLADLDAAIADADSGEFASDEEAEAFFARCRV
jgi:predicted transcriptional regulator